MKSACVSTSQKTTRFDLVVLFIEIASSRNHPQFSILSLQRDTRESPWRTRRRTSANEDFKRLLYWTRYGDAWLSDKSRAGRFFVASTKRARAAARDSAGASRLPSRITGIIKGSASE